MRTFVTNISRHLNGLALTDEEANYLMEAVVAAAPSHTEHTTPVRPHFIVRNMDAWTTCPRPREYQEYSEASQHAQKSVKQTGNRMAIYRLVSLSELQDPPIKTTLITSPFSV